MAMSSVVGIRFEDELLGRLKEVSSHFRLSQSQIARTAIEAYVKELKEEIEDYNDAMEVLKNSNGDAKSLEEVMRECGLEDQN